MADIPATVVVPENEEANNWHVRGCASFDQRTGGAGGDRLGALQAILTSTDRLWDNGQVITCTFVAPRGTPIQQQKVKTVVKEWAKYVNLTFKFVTTRNADIRIAFDPEEGSWSYVGTETLTIPKKDEPTMNYAWITPGSTITKEDKSVILHEFGHAIGYRHEHQSSRRGEKITLIEPLVLEFYLRTQRRWAPEMVRQQILDIYNDSDVSSFSAVDLTSIMMYFMPAELNVQHIEIKPNTALSETDKAFGFINYPYFPPGGNPHDHSWTLSKALDTAGVQGDARASIEREYKEKDWRGMRAEFVLWSINQRAIAIAAKIAKDRAAAGQGGIQIPIVPNIDNVANVLAVTA